MDFHPAKPCRQVWFIADSIGGDGPGEGNMEFLEAVTESSKDKDDTTHLGIIYPINYTF